MILSSACRQWRADTHPTIWDEPWSSKLHHVLGHDLSDLSGEALSSMGTVFATVQRALMALGTTRVYIGRYGHSPGYPIHFHAIPIYEWVEDLFWKDDRYRLLEQFADGPGETPTDGAELTFFVWREFCERADPPPIKGPSVSETIALLRHAIQF
jgi:diadenosine tetraphosphate (Ap4A) HIT family hydrolase